MSELDGAEEGNSLQNITKLAGQFMLEWAFFVVAEAVGAILFDLAWSLFKPDTAAISYLKLRHDFLPWAGVTFVGLGVYKFLKGGRSEGFIPPPLD